MSRLRELLVDGLLLALPLAGAIVLLIKAVQLAAKVLRPIGALTPPGRLFGIGLADVLALVGLVLAFVLLGAFARSAIGRWISTRLERAVLYRIPGFMMLKSTLRGFSQSEHADDFKPALVAFDDNTVLALVVESTEAPEGMVTVYVPGAPSTTSGAVMLVQRSRVTYLKANAAGAVRSLSRLGDGLQSLRAAPTRGDTGDPPTT